MALPEDDEPLLPDCALDCGSDTQYGKTKKKRAKTQKKKNLGFFRSKTLKNVILRFEGLAGGSGQGQNLVFFKFSGS